MRKQRPLCRTHETKMRWWPRVPSLLGEVPPTPQGGSRLTPPVIFLDIDGVLNQGYEFIKGGPRRELKTFVDPACIERLNAIVEATGAVVVISSTWRVGRPVFQLQLDMAGVHFNGRTVGRTDCLPCEFHAPAECSEAHRGTEIGKWLEEHPMVTKFCILDDDSDMGPFWPWLVHVQGRTGLTDAGRDMAIQLLIHGPNPKDLDEVREAVVGYYDEPEGDQDSGSESLPNEDVGAGSEVYEGQGDGGAKDAVDLPAGEPNPDGGVGGGTDGTS
jgi:hypothetical protein